MSPWGADSGHFDLARAVLAHATAIFCIALQAGAGHGLLSRTPLAGVSRGGVETALFSWLAGFVLTTALALGLTAAGFLDAFGAGALAVGLAVLSLPTLLAIAPRVASGVRFLLRASTRPDAAALALGAAAVVGAAVWFWPLIAQTLLPNSDWDSAAYHLPLAKRYTEGILWNGDPLLHTWSFPGAVSLLYGVVLALGIPEAVIPLDWYAAILTLACVCTLATGLGGRVRAGVWAGIVFTSTHIFWQLAVDPRVDGFFALFTLLAFYALSAWVRSRDPRWLVFLALAANAALGTKYIALLYAGGLVVIALVRVAVLHASAVERVRPRLLVVCALLLVVPNGAWYVANAALHHDPVYPFLSGGGGYYLDSAGARASLAEALEPRLAESAGAPAIRETLHAFQQVRRTYEKRSLLDPWSILTEPDRYAVKPNHFASPLLLLFLALPLVVRRETAEGRAALVVYAVSLGSYLIIGSATDVLRYVLPLLAVFAALAGVVLGAVRSRAWVLAWGALAVAVLVFHMRAEREKVEVLETARYLDGSLDRIGWLSEVGYNFTPAMPQMIRHVNGLVAEGAMAERDKVFMVGEAKGLLLRTAYIPDPSWQLDRWLVELLNADLDLARVDQSLREQGVSHVLYNRGYTIWVLESTDIPADRLAFALVHLERFLERHAVLLHRGDQILLYRLKSAAARGEGAGGSAS